MTREELMEKLMELKEEIGQVDHQGCKGILCLLMSAMAMYSEDALFLVMIPVQQELVDMAKRMQARMN